MQRASLRRVGRVWAVIAAIAGVSGCGDDGQIATTEGSSSGSESSSTGSSATTTDGPDTMLPTGEPDPTTGSTDSGQTADGTTTTEVTTTGEPTTDSEDGPNEKPVALVDNFFAKARQPLAPTAVNGVLKNDYDPDGDPLTVIASDPLTPGGAEVTMPQDGSFSYFPPPDLWGDDSFTYKIWDGKTGFASTTVNVTLSPTAIPLGAVAAGRGGFVIDGVAPDDFAGRAVQSLGDLNKDGLGDLLIAAPNVAEDTGRVYVVFGRSSGEVVSLADLADQDAGFEITGAAPGDFAGSSISGAGDVDGDGVPDILIGAPKATLNGKQSGVAYVVLGKADSEQVFLSGVAVGEGGFSIEGEAAQHFAGHSVRGAGNVNGDGLADLVLGAYGAEPNGIFSGRAYVVFGRGAGKPAQLSEISQGLGEGFVINGEAEFDFAGAAVGGAGDVNGDGLADLVVGAYGADTQGDTSGRAYVVFGKQDAAPVELGQVAANVGGFALDGEAAFDQAGAAVAGAGDVNGDGLADVVIGAPLSDKSTKDGGRSYVVFGKQEPGLVALSAVAAGDGGFAVDGQQQRDYSGFAVDAAGDVNGDGLDDVLIGAYGANPVGDASGRSYVVFGKPDGQVVNLFAVTNGDGGFVLDGEHGEDYSGFSVARAGDVDGDGFADVVIGAFANDAKGAQSGRSYAVFGGDYSNLARNVGGPGPDNFAGTAAAEIFVGGRGDDTITGQGGADIFYCGAGDDDVRLMDLEFRRIDGGAGEDTLRLMGAGLNLDLSARPDDDLLRVEIIDLADGGHTLVLARRDLLALTRTTHVLTIAGSQGNVEADLTGGGFIEQGVVDGYKLFSDGVTSLRIAEALATNVTL